MWWNRGDIVVNNLFLWINWRNMFKNYFVKQYKIVWRANSYSVTLKCKWIQIFMTCGVVSNPLSCHFTILYTANNGNCRSMVFLVFSCAITMSRPLSCLAECSSNGGMPGNVVEMVFYPGATRKHTVPPMWSRTRSRALLPATVGKSYSRHGAETQCVSFVNTDLTLVNAGHEAKMLWWACDMFADFCTQHWGKGQDSLDFNLCLSFYHNIVSLNMGYICRGFLDTCALT